MLFLVAIAQKRVVVSPCFENLSILDLCICMKTFCCFQRKNLTNHYGGLYISNVELFVAVCVFLSQNKSALYIYNRPSNYDVDFRVYIHWFLDLEYFLHYCRASSLTN